MTESWRTDVYLLAPAHILEPPTWKSGYDLLCRLVLPQALVEC